MDEEEDNKYRSIMRDNAATGGRMGFMMGQKYP
jgi:hypothetical protein